MYRYYERETYQGHTTPVSGSTRISLKNLRHLPKVGTPQLVRGYVARGRDGIIRHFVEVQGDQGAIRFGGFSWGYGGTGPAGLNTLFRRLGVLPLAGSIAPHPDFSANSIGEYWRLNLARPNRQAKPAPKKCTKNTRKNKPVAA